MQEAGHARVANAMVGVIVYYVTSTLQGMAWQGSAVGTERSRERELGQCTADARRLALVLSFYTCLWSWRGLGMPCIRFVLLNI